MFWDEPTADADWEREMDRTEHEAVEREARYEAEREADIDEADAEYEPEPREMFGWLAWDQAASDAEAERERFPF